jgi:hypothetical protein
MPIRSSAFPRAARVGLDVQRDAHCGAVGPSSRLNIAIDGIAVVLHRVGREVRTVHDDGELAVRLGPSVALDRDNRSVGPDLGHDADMSRGGGGTRSGPEQDGVAGRRH